MRRAPSISSGCARRPSGSSPSDTCWRRTWTRWWSAPGGSGISSPALEPLVDLLARRHPDALVAADVIVGGLEVLDAVGHAVDVRVHGDRHASWIFSPLEG